MPSDKFSRQLRREAKKWQSEGLISASVYEQLAQRYQFSNIETAARNRFVLILIGLGSLLLGLAVITFVAANWQVWSRELKVILLLGLFVGANTAGFYLWRRPTQGWQRRLGQGLLLLGALILGANLAVMSQLFHQSGLLYQLFLVWGLGVLAMAYSLRFTWLGILAILLIGSGYGQSLSEVESIGEFFWLRGMVQYMPVLAGLMFIPLAYWCHSQWLFRLGAIAVVYSLEASLIDLELLDSPAWIAAIACALPPALLWAYSGFLWVKHSPLAHSFDRIARTLAITFLSLLFYMLSFHWVWKASPIPAAKATSPLPWFVLINLLILGFLTIWGWLQLLVPIRIGLVKRRQTPPVSPQGGKTEGSPDEKIFTTMHENPSLRVSASPRPRVYFQIRGQKEKVFLSFTADGAPPVGGLLINSIVAIMIVTSGLVPYWHLRISSLPVAAVWLFNLLLFLLAAGLVRQGLAQGQRSLFWGGMVLLSLQIFSRMLEYNTDLVFKSLVLFLCGAGVIAAGLWFERYIRTLEPPSHLRE